MIFIRLTWQGFLSGSPRRMFTLPFFFRKIVRIEQRAYKSKNYRYGPVVAAIWVSCTEGAGVGVYSKPLNLINSLTEKIVILNYLKTVDVPAGYKAPNKYCLVWSCLALSLDKARK